MTIMKSNLISTRDALVATLNHISRPAFLSWYYRERPRLMKFRGRHSGECCFIIGNGPSLNKMDLSLLSRCHTFGLNKIYLMNERVKLNLSYHVAVNPLVIQQSVDEFSSMRCPSFLSADASHKILPSSELIYKIWTGGPFLFQKDMTKSLFEGATVTYIALQIAFFMGFHKVFLIGVDHNFIAQGNPHEKQFLKEVIQITSRLTILAMKSGTCQIWSAQS